jgi:hypothetical protein
MPEISLIAIGFASALACIGLGGAFYQFSVVDPAWPRRPDLIQPGRGGLSCRRFWIPAHFAFELALIVALITGWSGPARLWLLVAFGSHAAMRLWSAIDFIPKALAFERADPVTEAAARRWTRRSLGRLPLDLVTCGAMLAAFASAARIG